MKRLLIVKHTLATLWVLALGVSFANAQANVFTIPNGVASTNLSSTIAVTNTFQSVFSSQTSTPHSGRSSCTIINYGSNTMWVFAGPIASATKASSVQLAVGQAFYCATGVGTTLKDQISITGTATEAFYAAQQ